MYEKITAAVFFSVSDCMPPEPVKCLRDKKLKIGARDESPISWDAIPISRMGVILADMKK